jgi:hypothetical protein
MLLLGKVAAVVVSTTELEGRAWSTADGSVGSVPCPWCCLLTLPAQASTSWACGPAGHVGTLGAGCWHSHPLPTCACIRTECRQRLGLGPSVHVPQAHVWRLRPAWHGTSCICNRLGPPALQVGCSVAPPLALPGGDACMIHDLAAVVPTWRVTLMVGGERQQPVCTGGVGMHGWGPHVLLPCS